MSKNVKKKILKHFFVVVCFPSQVELLNYEEANLELVVANFLLHYEKSCRNKGDRKENDVNKWRVPEFRCCWCLPIPELSVMRDNNFYFSPKPVYPIICNQNNKVVYWNLRPAYL